MLRRYLLAILGFSFLLGAGFLVLPVWVNFPDSAFGLVIICLLLMAAFVFFTKAFSGVRARMKS